MSIMLSEVKERVSSKIKGYIKVKYIQTKKINIVLNSSVIDQKQVKQDHGSSAAFSLL